jgi:hypothetical protein
MARLLFPGPIAEWWWGVERVTEDDPVVVDS